MKKYLLAILVAVSFNVSAETFSDTARVISVEPRYTTVRAPINECRTRLIEDRSSNIGGAVLGGITGGVIGNQIGAGQGRDAAVAAGIMLGAITGDRLSNQRNSVREITECNRVYTTESIVTGYTVQYSYLNNIYTVVTRNNPGSTITVRVTVSAIE